MIQYPLQERVVVGIVYFTIQIIGGFGAETVEPDAPFGIFVNAQDFVDGQAIGTGEIGELYPVKSTDSPVGANPDKAVSVLGDAIDLIRNEPIVDVEIPVIRMLALCVETKQQKWNEK